MIEYMHRRDAESRDISRAEIMNFLRNQALPGTGR
jgi:hypothetical protein